MNEDFYRDYDAFADAYVHVSRVNFFNARFERPAIRAMSGEVAGRDVLDAGCAGGEQSAWLADHGARVVALDANPRMVALARERLGDRAAVIEHDLRMPLPFEDAAFDLVFSSLTLHYVRDWVPLLREFSRVLRPGGAFVASTHHPNMPLVDGGARDQLRLIDDRWSGFASQPVRVRYWHRPFSDMQRAFTAAGLRIERTADLRVEHRDEPFFLILRAVAA